MLQDVLLLLLLLLLLLPAVMAVVAAAGLLLLLLCLSPHPLLWLSHSLGGGCWLSTSPSGLEAMGLGQTEEGLPDETRLVEQQEASLALFGRGCSAPSTGASPPPSAFSSTTTEPSTTSDMG